MGPSTLATGSGNFFQSEDAKPKPPCSARGGASHPCDKSRRELHVLGIRFIRPVNHHFFVNPQESIDESELSTDHRLLSDSNLMYFGAREKPPGNLI